MSSCKESTTRKRPHDDKSEEELIEGPPQLVAKKAAKRKKSNTSTKQTSVKLTTIQLTKQNHARIIEDISAYENKKKELIEKMKVNTAQFSVAFETLPKEELDDCDASKNIAILGGQYAQAEKELSKSKRRLTMIKKKMLKLGIPDDV